jgi:uracil-DNA glycosylase
MKRTSNKDARAPAVRATGQSRPDELTSRSAADYLPERRSVGSLRRAEQSFRGCELFQRATQTVAGEGPATARMFLVGEAAGDLEDKTGHPFVGPAGSLLNQALEAEPRGRWSRVDHYILSMGV